MGCPIDRGQWLNQKSHRPLDVRPYLPSHSPLKLLLFGCITLSLMSVILCAGGSSYSGWTGICLWRSQTGAWRVWHSAETSASDPAGCVWCATRSTAVQHSGVYVSRNCSHHRGYLDIKARQAPSLSLSFSISLAPFLSSHECLDAVNVRTAGQWILLKS